MHLIQLLLPLYDNQGRKFKTALFHDVKVNLSNRFHGLTAYNRSVAEGLWRVGKSVKRDDIVVYEVMTGTLNLKWWKNYRRTLEKKFQQESIVIRAQKITVV